MNPTARGDAGVATVWAALAVVAILGIVLAAIDLGAAVAARHRAEAAADLAALAAAAEAARGQEPACERARRTAELTGGRMRRCALIGWDAQVEVTISRRLRLLGPADAHARARAGPAPIQDRASLDPTGVTTARPGIEAAP
ncbi:Rv3654c family TadE-like protein [Pseudonocardia hispaniensis]|uniref:Rv3654c family TadE-like protein n=1 Tax=Pseudonocardia hispaniensis TaxID=904933 RepID=A0ABW1J145_9PSEU